MEEKNLNRSKKRLTTPQKILFGMVCWGIHTWSQLKYFKDKGFDQKYIEAKRAIYTGIIIYVLGITLFLIFFIFN